MLDIVKMTLSALFSVFLQYRGKGILLHYIHCIHEETRLKEEAHKGLHSVMYRVGIGFL